MGKWEIGKLGNGNGDIERKGEEGGFSFSLIAFFV